MAQHNSSISNFKHFSLKFICPLLLLIIIGGYSFQYFFEKTVILKNSISGAYKVNRIINELHPDEVAMIGSSRMEGGLIPDILGKNYFNYGLNGTKDNVSLFFLNEETKKNKTTPIIINIDIGGLNNSMGYILYYLYNINYQPVRDIVAEQDKPYYHIPFIKYYGYYELYLKDYLTAKIELTKYSNKGASIEKNILLLQKFSEEVKQRENTPAAFNVDPNLGSRLISIVTSHLNRKFIFVVAPCHPSCFSMYKNESDEIKYLNFLKTYKNVRVFNFSKDHYPDSLFFNTEHLNYNGAIKYSKALRDSLSKI